MPSYFTYATKDGLKATLAQEPQNQELEALVKTYPNNHGGLIITDDASANAVQTVTKGVSCFDIGKDRQLIPAGELISFLGVANTWEPDTWVEKVAGKVISGERMMAILDSLRTMPVLSTRITSFGCPWDFFQWFSALPSQLKEELLERESMQRKLVTKMFPEALIAGEFENGEWKSWGRVDAAKCGTTPCSFYTRARQ